jgi:hypothetical protein
MGRRYHLTERYRHRLSLRVRDGALYLARFDEHRPLD